MKNGKALSGTAKIPEKVKTVYRRRTMYGDLESESFPVKVHPKICAGLHAYGIPQG